MKNITVSIGNTAISGSVQDVAEPMKYISADGSSFVKQQAGQEERTNKYHRDMSSRQCKLCGKEYVPNSNNQSYCGELCSLSAKRANAVKWYYRNVSANKKKNHDERGELQLEERLQDNGSKPLFDHIYGHREQ